MVCLKTTKQGDCMKYIGRKMIEDGLMAKVIIPFKDNEELKVQIGEYWFYINHAGYEHKPVIEIPFYELVNRIKDTLDDFFVDFDYSEYEYLYYYHYLCENI